MAVALSNFTRSLAAPSEVVRPAGEAEWLRLLERADGRGVTVRGAGASYGDAALNSGGTVALTGALRDVGEVDGGSGTVDVGAGATLADVLAVTLPAGWTLPVLPGTGRVTVGGAVAADVHGKNHPARSSIGAHIESLVLVSPAGGVRTLTPDGSPGPFWATVGGLGLTGVVLRVRLRLERTGGWVRSADRAEPTLDRVVEELGRNDAGSAVAWLDGHSGGPALGRGVVTTAVPVGGPTGEASATGRAGARAVGRAAARARRPAPRAATAPGTGRPARRRPRSPLLLSASAVRVANAARFAAARAHGGRPRLVELRRSLFPLDALPGWPALYGRRGFLQHQLAVPPGQEGVLALALRALQDAGHPPALAVLKRLGAPPAGHEAGTLSFPLPGWTLALDVAVPPAGPGAVRLARTLDDLDQAVAAAGGRTSLVKDSRLRPDLLRRMYPGLDRWRAEAARLDPDGVMTSDLDRRLGLRGAGAGPC
ncbi:decaprenylphospho-beta-D-ribofuranose 2-oxidase [Georgenia soli]|uniref:Decaprenylphospho-beta-D-ribofuranose 2-oxidase n=1 Tax=Georgenia soli TaxID=638953 RepID=A0A2A9EM69_9MICO|nr:FAD-binding oxidoreductase [Georgenia soli]PFG39352.1 decaprenylphospho-beta-D-ribofuranose 2-oxidase [Georgenia soli]